MERIKIYDILHHDHLCQITLNSCDAPRVKGLFEQLDKKGIKIKFFASNQAINQTLLLSFCIERSDLKTARNILLQLPIRDADIQVTPEAGMVAIYGPHFGEKPGIIDIMHQALSRQGVESLAISTTISTSYFVIPAADVERAVTILQETFEIPRGKA